MWIMNGNRQMTVAIRTAFQGLLTAAFLLQLSSFEPLRSLGQETKPLQHAWEVDPDFGDVWGSKLEVRAKYIELEDLRSDQAQLRLEAAQAICTNFDRKGFQDKSKALDLLIEQLDNPQNTTLIRRSILSAACLLDDGSHAATIWKQAEQDPASRGIAERYLAKWKSPIAKDLWRKRLSDSKVAQSDLVLALDGLAQVGEEQDATAIKIGRAHV